MRVYTLKSFLIFLRNALFLLVNRRLT